MRVNNELIKLVFQESEEYKYDKKFLIRIQFHPNYFFEYIKKDCEDRWNAEYFTDEEIEVVRDLFYAALDVLDENDFAVWCYGDGGNSGIAYDAEFRRKFRYDHDWSKMLFVMEKPISFNPFYKRIKHNYYTNKIVVNGIKCKTYDEALKEIHKLFAEFKEETDGYKNPEQNEGD